MSVIELDRVCEKYRIKFIKEGAVTWEEFPALEDISFKVDRGEVLGVIGRNGAGKTTLLRLIAGMLVPDKGNINVEGKVSALMELGAGFNPEFTGRENLIHNARMYGLEGKILNQQIDKIIDFAGLDKFIDAPVKYYSQGMFMRLAFALAIYVEPDILLIDDILAVGDEEAQQRCIRKVLELKESGKTIILVSHEMNMVSRLCDRTILLNKGRIIKEGKPEKLIAYYLENVGNENGISVLEKDKFIVVFNNGRINFSYDDNMLTKGMGGYVSFFMPGINIWSSSFNLDWRINSRFPDEIIAEGKNIYNLTSQVWKIKIENNDLLWNVEIKDDSLKEPHIDLLLIPQYKKWATFEAKEEFPSFMHKSNWQDLGFVNSKGGMLRLILDPDNNALPEFIFENINKDNKIKLFNTGYEQEARVIQSFSSNDSIISMNIKIFQQRNQLEDYFVKSRDQFLLGQEEERNLLLRKQEDELSRLIAGRTLIHDNLRLFADPETKSLRLYFKDKEITKERGLHSSFLLGNTWQDNSSSEWQVEKDNNELILNLSWKQPRLTQTWRLFFKDDFLFWSINSRVEEKVDFKMQKFGLSLQDKYKSFFCGHQQADFPQDFISWQDMLLEAENARFLGARKNSESPAVVLENKEGFACVIQNSDDQIRCRTLQLYVPPKILNKEGFTFSMKVSLKEESLIEDYINQEAKRLSSLSTITSGDIKLLAEPETKSLRLYFNDKEITSSDGLSCAFLVSQHWFRLKDAQWHLNKVSEKELVLILDYPSLSLSETWKFVSKDDNRLGIKMYMDFDKQTLISSLDVSLQLQDIFKHWFTAYEQGNFIINQYINNIGPIRLKDNKVSKVAVATGSNKPFSQLVFENFFEPDRRILGIYKQNQEKAGSICLNLSMARAKKEESVVAGKYTYFDGDIVIGKDIKLEELSSPGILILDKDKLRFIFDRGRGRIYWREKELTSGLSMYTAVRSLGIWYDSYQARWDLIESEKNAITVLGYWPYIPISQLWRFELLNKAEILWSIDSDIYEDADLEIEQVNLMLSSEYKNWIIKDTAKGEFIDEYTLDYDILNFRFWYGRAQKKEIGAAGTGLPSIWLRDKSQEDTFRAIVENTDYLYKARLLQFQKHNISKLSPKKYRYFEGVIRIEP